MNKMKSEKSGLAFTALLPLVVFVSLLACLLVGLDATVVPMR